VQTITPPGSGTFTYTVTIGTNTQTSAAIAFNAAAATVQAAIQAMPNVGVGNATVTGTGPYVVTFAGTLAAQLISIGTVSAGGIAHTTSGAGTWSIGGGSVSWPGATFTAPNAARYGAIVDVTPGTAATNPLCGIVDFITDQSPTNGTLSVTWDPTGIIVVQVS
jgi:hypothetical protein